ncbi:hypothetical protein [Paraburkholderia dilworthii]|uniref:hypothetical protein n=1 Tax=Paraburkholderia dilworthii TaxID=948106 RepID=UPI0004237FD1|nr:hypothetical protein [Paraburkholderia dilworthii]
MTKFTLHLVCGVLFCAAQATHAETTANSSSGSVSGSSSVGIGQGGGSSLNNIGTSSNSSATTNSNSSSVGGIGRANATGGSSNVNVSVTMPTLTASTGAGTGNGGGIDATGKAASGPGSSAYDTRATVDYNQSSYSVRTTPSIAAPGLTTTLSDTCMGSTSFGLSVTGFGLTGGTTQVDQACVRRLDAREFRAMGLTDVALALLCQSDANRKAVEATGHLCPGTTAPLARASEVPQYSDDEKYRDPLVRARLGLPVYSTSEQPLGHPQPVSGSTKPAPFKDQRNGVAAAKPVRLTDDSTEISLVK